MLTHTVSRETKGKVVGVSACAISKKRNLFMVRCASIIIRGSLASSAHFAIIQWAGDVKLNQGWASERKGRRKPMGRARFRIVFATGIRVYIRRVVVLV